MNLVAGAGLGYEPDELPDCSIPQRKVRVLFHLCQNLIKNQFFSVKRLGCIGDIGSYDSANCIDRKYSSQNIC